MHTKEDILYRTILIASLVIGLIILAFILSIIRQQRKFSQLNLRKVEIEINTLENERKRIAADLHDELGAVLSATKFKLESLDSFSASDQLQVDQCIHLINDIIAKLRWISNGLMPNTLLHNGIVSALNEFINKVNYDSGLEIIFNSHDIPELSATPCIHIFRILQEIIHNTIKHAKADTLKIELFTQKGKLLILTADDGIGFEYNNVIKNKKGLGLENLQNRASLLGGEMHIRTNLGEGTRCHIALPL